MGIEKTILKILLILSKNWSIIVIRNSEKSLQAIRHEKDFAPTCFIGWIICL